MIRKILDFFMSGILFTIMFVVSFNILMSFDIVPHIVWYAYFLTGFSMTLIFRLFGRIIGAKNV